jgi:tRNA(Leu) C34 or U34 (ribose-2'-O)-methylase TrmL
MAGREGAFVKGTESLVDFVHPLDATYVFGPDSRHMTDDDLSVNFLARVYIPTDPTGTSLFAGSAFSVLMYDRMQKGK